MTTPLCLLPFCPVSIFKIHYLFIIYPCIQLKLQEYLRQPEYNYTGCNLAIEIRFFQKALQVLAKRHLQKPCRDRHLGFSRHPKQVSSCYRMPLHPTARHGFGLEITPMSSSTFLHRVGVPGRFSFPLLSPWAGSDETAGLGDTATHAEGWASSLPFPSQETFQACHSTNWHSILTDCLYLCGQPNM